MKKRLLNKFKKIISYMLVMSMITCNLIFVPVTQAVGEELIIGNATANNNESISIPITAGNSFSDVGSVTIYVNYDLNFLEYTDHTLDQLPPATVSQTGNQITILWFASIGADPISFDSEDILLNLNFKVISGDTTTTNITFDSSSVIGNSSGNSISTIFTDGIIALNDTTPPTITSYTLSGAESNTTFNPNSSETVEIILNADEDIDNWVSLKIENVDDDGIYKYYSPSDDCDGNSQCVETWDGSLSSGTLVDGDYKIKVKIKDEAGNIFDEYLDHYIIVDTTAPIRSDGLPTGQLSSGTTQTSISLTTNENATCKYSVTQNIEYHLMTNTFLATGGGAAHSATITNLVDGQSYVYYVKCKDELDTYNTDDFEISFSIAETPNNPPVMNLIGNKTVVEGEALTFTISATDVDGDDLIYSASNLPEGANFDTGTKTFSWTPNIGQAEIYSNVRFEVSDGDAVAFEEITITVTEIPDTIPPTATLSGTPNNPTNQTTANIAVSGDGIVFYKYNLDGAGYGAEISIDTNIVLSGLANGAHTLFVKGRDDAGNWSDEISETWTIDLTAPNSPAIVNPAETIILNSDTYSITGTAENNSLVEIYRGTELAGSQQLGTGETDYSIEVNLAQNSDNNFIAIAVDLAGNESVSSTVFTITEDSIAPVITLNGGDMNIYQGTIYTERAVATDNLDTEVKINIGGDTVDTATVGTYVITYNAADSSENKATEIKRTILVFAVAESQTVLTDEVSLDTSAPEVLIGSNAPAGSTIIAPSSVVNGTLNVSALLSGTDTKNVDLQTNITIQSATSIGDVNVAIPAGQISADSNWTGEINFPQVKENSSVTVTPDSGKTANVSSVIEIGFDDVKLNFDKAVRIELKNQAGRYAGYSRSGTFTRITQTCGSDTQSVGDALTADGDCKIKVGSDLIIWTKHFTKFITYTQTVIAVQPSSGGGGGIFIDRTPPSQPKDFQAKRDGKQIVISWTNPSDSDFRDVVLVKSLETIDGSMTLTQLKTKGKEIYQGKDKQYIDTEIEEGKNYYYGLVAFDNNSNRAKPVIIEVKPEIKFKQILDEILDKYEVKVLGVEFDEREVQLADIAQDANDVYDGNVVLTLANTDSKRDFKAESDGYKDYTSKLTSGAVGLSSNNIYAITNFVVYGTKTTQTLGVGERAGVINSYKSAFGKLPSSQAEWEDVVKIANGRWPSETNSAAEVKAKEEFKKIYKKEANMANPNDNAAVTVIAYGLRPSDRNLGNEKIAANFFKAIFKYNPASATDWDIVRAIAYSGATR
ncbi:MAG: putative Ig domain-containing protein [bacterium]